LQNNSESNSNLDPEDLVSVCDSNLYVKLSRSAQSTYYTQKNNEHTKNNMT